MTRDQKRPTPMYPHDPQAGAVLAALDASISRALSEPPDVVIRQNFAAMVAQRASAQPRPYALRRLGWGPRLALGSGALLLVGMFALAPHATPSLNDLRFDAELILLTELSALLLFSHRLVARD